MTKQEFLTELQKALTNKLSSAAVSNHVNYYREYIETEVRKGREEAEVTAELGNPRLIAKSILTAAKADGQESIAKEAESIGNEGNTMQNIFAKIPGWLWIVIILLIVVIVGAFVTSVIWRLLPVILPIILVVFLVKWWNNNR